jgi:uncharacterized protein (DUF2336 family)
MTLNAQTLLAELDTTLSEVSQDWRTAVLRQIADMFFNSAELYSKDQVALFDAVMSLLLPGVDRPTLAELSNRLTGAPLPPPKVLASLANHPDLEVCGPVLERSKALPDKVLVEVADREQHPGEDRGSRAARRDGHRQPAQTRNAAIQRTILENPNARVSENGFARVIMGLDGDKSLAQMVAARQDLPAELRPWLNDILKS